MTTSNLAAFAAELTCPEAAPGPVAACAAAAALGTSLLSMALRTASGEDRSQTPYDLGRADELETLRERLFELGAEDAVVYARYVELDARQDRDDEAEKTRARMRERCLELPLEVMETALAALRLARVALPGIGSPGLQADLRAGARLAYGALLAVRELFEENVRVFPPEAVADRAGVSATVCSEAERVFDELSAESAESAESLGGTS